MSHRVALYTVQVNKKHARTFRALGDIDESGTALADELARGLDNFPEPVEGAEKSVRILNVEHGGEEVRVLLQHGETNVAAEIVDETGDHQYRQRLSDSHLVRCGALFVLPPEQERGWLAIHINNNRGVKSYLEAGIQAQFSNRFDDLTLRINPYVEAGVLLAAVEQGRLAKVRLLKHERPNDHAVAATNKWVAAGEWGTIELSIKAARGQRLSAGLLRNFLQQTGQQERNSARNEIVEFENLAFDEAKVEVELENGTRRTFNIERPAVGHPMTLDIEVELDDDGEPEGESLFESLREALASVR